jgi:hypothetical protein
MEKNYGECETQKQKRIGVELSRGWREADHKQIYEVG